MSRPLAHSPLEKAFHVLAARWKQDRGVTSFVSEMVEQSAYKQIIAIGPAVVPPLLRELEREPDFWFAALRALTGANPVQAENQGKLRQMANAWIIWGQQQGLV